jgi:hypothetical protein
MQIAQAQAQLLAQQESQRVRQLTEQEAQRTRLERERERLQSLQQQQLEETEIVLEQQRHFLTDANQDVLVDGCEAVPQCTGSGLGGGGRHGFFSAEA